jgi:hypothetical protein
MYLQLMQLSVTTWAIGIPSRNCEPIRRRSTKAITCVYLLSHVSDKSNINNISFIRYLSRGGQFGVWLRSRGFRGATKRRPIEANSLRKRPPSRPYTI